MSEVENKVWVEHPSEVPESFRIQCRNSHTWHTYTVPCEGTYAPLHRAIAWSMLRRQHSVGHAYREGLTTAVRYFVKFLDTTGEAAKDPGDVDAALLRRYTKWLKSDASHLSYRSASSTYRILGPALQQWIGQEWAAPNLTVPRHQFPELARAPRVAPAKGYSQEELDRIAACVLRDIAEHESHVYKPSYLGKPPPLEMVVVNPSDPTALGDRWTSIEYRTWWWEEHCQCQRLSVREIRAMPRGPSMVFGCAARSGIGSATYAAAERSLNEFYEEIGAGPDYMRKYPTEPTIYRTPWASWEYLVWYWDNHCEHRWTPEKPLRAEHKRFVGALREHFNGVEDFLKEIGVARQRPVMDYLCPYYVGLLLTTSLNPSTIQRLPMDCLINGVLDGERQSVAWTKPRAARSGLTIPASGAAKLSPQNLIERVLALTASSRGSRKYLFCSAEVKPSRATLPPHGGTFERAIKRWFVRHGICRAPEDSEMSEIHEASNFRPAIAKLSYAKTGDINFVKSLLGHARVETTVDYVGAIPRDTLLISLGVHIEAIFLDATSVVPSVDPHAEYEETEDAHCRDILNSPIAGIRAGTMCNDHRACLGCQNLVVTHDDIVRYYARKSYYMAKLSVAEINQAEFDEMMDGRIYAFESQILPRYAPSLVEALKQHAIANPPQEYRT